MSLRIENYPNSRFNLLPCCKETRVSLSQSFRAHISNDDKLTKETALPILKQIVWESEVCSFFTRAIVLIPIGVVTTLLGYSIPAISITLLAIRMIVSFAGGFIIGYAVENHFNGFLQQLREAHMNLASRGKAYIERLETAEGEVEITLPFIGEEIRTQFRR